MGTPTSYPTAAVNSTVGFPDSVIGIARAHAGWLAVLAMSTIGLLLVATRQPAILAPFADLPSVALSLVLVAVLAALLVIVTRLRHRVSYRAAWARLRQGTLASDRLWGLLIVVAGTRWLLLTAVAWKSALPLLHPFAFDLPLAQLDRVLHGGDAWRLIPRHPAVLWTLDRFYYGWFVAFAAVMLWWGWKADSPERRRFLLSMALLWTVGSLLAVLLSSAGPVYFDRVTGLAGGYPSLPSHLLAAQVQTILWQSHLAGPGQTIAGIAAMPSLHVAVPALYALASTGRWRWLWWGFTALTLVGSVALGWHYAVDGYAGILLSWLMWRVAGWLT